MISWHDYYLWAGIFLLCFHLCLFLRQRKLFDENTAVFLWLVILGICGCALGVVLTNLQNGQISLGRFPTLLLFSAHYFLQALLPYVLLCFIATRMEFDRARRRRILRLGLLPLMGSAALILLNIPLGFLSYIAEDGLLYIRPLFHLYVCWILLCLLLDLGCLWLGRRELHNRGPGALAGGCLITALGFFAQHYLGFQMFFGFSVALAVSLFHLTMKNPNAYIDIGTRVFNVRYFDVWMAEKLSAPWRGILLTVDLYQMDQIARLYADGTGARLASAAAEYLWKLEPRPKVFRLIAGRFVIWADTEAQADRILQQCQERLASPFQIGGRLIRCPAVLVKIPLAGELSSVEELNAYISFCVQQADSSVPVQTIWDSHDLWRRFNYEVEVERFLKTALEQDLFQVWYQPVWSLRERRFVALEALSRLRHPKLGWISPELFIRVAANDGLLSQIMPRQLEKVCRFAREHAEIFQTIRNIKINLSPEELSEPDYCEKLLHIIRANGLDPARFQFEVTEGTATRYSQELTACVAHLEQAGVSLCLDDFGSGYANLNTVMRLPFTTIKLDRSLLSGVCDDQAVSAFYQNVADILDRLGYDVVAEGVETEQEVELLSAWHVGLIQGYYFSKPLPPEQVPERVLSALG